MQVAPKEIGVRHRNGNQIPPVDCDAGTLRRRIADGTFFQPFPHPDFPHRQCLQRRRFAGIVGADEYYGIPELNLDIFEALEVSDVESGEHFR